MWKPSLLLSLSLVTLLVVPALAEEGRIAVGLDDSIYELKSGSYAELFPGGSAASGRSHVLALDVRRSDGGRERWLVPGTETDDVESSEVLVYERGLNRVYLFWESLVSGVHPAMFLVSFDGAEWGDSLEFVGSPFARKESLQLQVSRIPSPLREAGDLTVLHVFWAEERPAASVKRYAPVVIADGKYLGWTAVYDLETFSVHREDTEQSDVSAGLVDSLRAQEGRDSDSCVVGFVDPSDHRMETLEIQVLPPILVSLADKARLEFIGLGQRAEIDSLEQLAAAIVERLFDLGREFHPSVLRFMAARIQGLIEAAGATLDEEALIVLGNEIWAEIIAVGSAVGQNGLAESEDFHLVEISSPVDVEGARHLLKVTPVSSRIAPEVDGEATLWLSESGHHVLVTWEDERAIYYRESLADEDGWSEVGILELGNGLGRDDIYRTLAERVRTR
jgi:hypothetical protein